MPASKTNNINTHHALEDHAYSVRHSAAPQKKRGFLERGTNSKNICCSTVQILALMMISMFLFVISYNISTSKQVIFSFVSILIASKMNNIWLDFSQAVDFQQRLYPQHYPVMVPVMVPIGKAMFMSLPSKDCADSDANHHVYCWSSHWAKPYGGQGQVPHSSAKVVGSNSGQACSDEQSIAASVSLLMRWVQHSPIKKLDAVLKNSVQHMIHQERSKLTNVMLEGVEVTTELSSLKKNCRMQCGSR